MYSVRELSGSIADMFDPAFRKIDFADETAIVIVSTHLRHAWTALPSPDSESSPTANSIGLSIKASHERTDEQRAVVAQNPNTTDIHTPWRTAIYEFWNHVFYDVMCWLPEVNCSVGHFHPPLHDVLAVPYTLCAYDDAPAIRKVWDTNVLIIPAYLVRGVAIRAVVVQGVEEGVEEEGKEKALGVFDEKNSAEIWYVRRGVEVRFYVEGKGEGGERRGRKGVAAVMVIGILCSEDHREEDHAEEKDGNEVGRLEEVEKNGSEDGAVGDVEHS